MSKKLITWDASRWLRAFRQSCQERDHRQIHQCRIDVYRHTIEVCQAGGYQLSKTGEEVLLPLNTRMLEETEFYENELPRQSPSTTYDTTIRVVKDDCLVQAHQLVGQGLEVCVLNMANRRTPGGGVIRGCGAQEEYLFRCSDYYRSLYAFSDYHSSEYQVPRSKHSYPMDRCYGGIFSRNVTIFRGSEEQGYPLIAHPWQVNMIALAGLNGPKVFRSPNGELLLCPREEETTRKKIHTLLRIALDHKQEHLILSALGCGAFHNPPRHIARIFKEILSEDEFKHAFRTVIFSIKEDHNSNNVNFSTFSEVFSNFEVPSSLNGRP